MDRWGGGDKTIRLVCNSCLLYLSDFCCMITYVRSVPMISKANLARTSSLVLVLVSLDVCATPGTAFLNLLDGVPTALFNTSASSEEASSSLIFSSLSKTFPKWERINWWLLGSLIPPNAVMKQKHVDRKFLYATSYSPLFSAFFPSSACTKALSICFFASSVAKEEKVQHYN